MMALTWLQAERHTREVILAGASFSDPGPPHALLAVLEELQAAPDL